MMNLILNSESDTAIFAQKLAPLLQAGDILFLEGELGAGKTSLTRYLAYALGIAGRIKSPTYALVESYTLPHGVELHHFDLYRLTEPREWFSAGFDEYINPHSIVLIEWSSQALGALPSADMVLHLTHVSENMRHLGIQTHSERGANILQQL